MSNQYNSISTPTTGLFKDRGSKFIAFLFRCATEEEFFIELNKIKKLHPKSRHFCYAYKLLDSERVNDDGEPSGTAGKPILGQIIKADLKEVGVVVVRYFGGTLLGTGGLIQAYKLSTAEAIDQAQPKIFEILVDIKITFDYLHLSPLMTCIKKNKFRIKSQKLEEIARVTLSVAPDMVSDTIIVIKAYLGNMYISEIKDDTKIHGVTITIEE